MLSRCRSGLFILLCLFLVGLVVGNAVAATVSYQGRLTDAAGVPLSELVEMTFTVYDAPDATGMILWQELQTVVVETGIFNVTLGAVNPFPENLFEQPACYLEIAVDGPGGTEVLDPRQPITATALAVVAEKAKGLTDGALTTAMIANDAVTTGQIADGSIQSADIANGATLAEILDNDGAGSELDADRLDGHDTAYFATTVSVVALQTQVAALQSQVNALVALLANVSRPDADTIRFSNVNLQIVSGSGATDGAKNGRGNLIVGYNELRGYGEDDRSGSHNIVVGRYHNFSSFGGLIAGNKNEISQEYASVTGGSDNVASGAVSSVSGGSNNTASGWGASVGGGQNNASRGQYAHVSGGGGVNDTDGNTAFGNFSVVLGGKRNTAGDPNLIDSAIGTGATVHGGDLNKASGNYASISSGLNNTASGFVSGIHGGYANQATNDYSAVCGGALNVAGGRFSNISGGSANSASGVYAAAFGGSGNTASGAYAATSGGGGNTAGGMGASVSGGTLNQSTGEYASVSGGSNNEASGTGASISGGRNNAASGGHSSVIGGGGPNANEGNLAFADYSSILGGETNGTGDVTIERDSNTGEYHMAPGSDHSMGIQSVVGGGWANIACGDRTVAGGGRVNTASGVEASVTGGAGNIASGPQASVSGGVNNTASAERSSVSGGASNTADGAQASISGGSDNTASGISSSISGGGDGTVSGPVDWLAGDLFQDY